MSENKCLTYAHCVEFSCCKDVIAYISPEDFKAYCANTPNARVKEVDEGHYALIVCWAGGIRDEQINQTLALHAGYLESLPDIVYCDFRKYDPRQIVDKRAVGKIGIFINKTCKHVIKNIGCDLYGPPDRRPKMCIKEKLGGAYCNHSRERDDLTYIASL